MMVRVGVILFVIGATVGSALDAIHTHSGTTVYTPELWLKAAWWTPLLFGLAGVGVGLAYVTVERWLGREIARAATWQRAGIAFGVFTLLYFASGYLPAANVVKLAVLVLGIVLLARMVAASVPALGVAVVVGLVGPVVEITLIHAGAFRHLQPDVFGIPIWLPALYASASFAIGTLGKKITDELQESRRRVRSS